ncbi:MAG: hypothetical protein JWM11_1254 [Planctomycetaceae bacterium]|nr:hypothetical protein [Planctomycetaceae bacterium]
MLIPFSPDYRGEGRYNVVATGAIFFDKSARGFGEKCQEIRTILRIATSYSEALRRKKAIDMTSLERQAAETRIECRASDHFADWMANLPGTLAVTTYQAGKLAFLGWRGQQLSLLMRQFDKPMGLAVDPLGSGKLALATRNEITLFANANLLAPEFLLNQPSQYDALFLPRVTYHTADLNVHDVGWGHDGVWFVNSRFSCLSRLSSDYSFVPCWQPPFISELVPEDRCHLNGLAMFEGRPKYVTALGECDKVGGWRENKAAGGILLDVESREILVRGLSMPHSPRWHQGRLYLLNSGTGELLAFDPVTFKIDSICTLPAYLRGLCLIDNWAVVGLCQIRETHIFGGLPVQQKFKQLLCGLGVVDLGTGNLVATFQFTSGCTEIYDIQFLPGMRTPNILNLTQEPTRQAFTAPDFSYWLRPENMLPT